jgi:hypothetical protein
VATNFGDGNFWHFCATEAGSGIPAQLEVVAISARQAGRYFPHPMNCAACAAGVFTGLAYEISFFGRYYATLD